MGGGGGGGRKIRGPGSRTRSTSFSASENKNHLSEVGSPPPKGISGEALKHRARGQKDGEEKSNKKGRA